MTASQSGVFSLQEFTDAGALLVGGRLYTYTSGTTTFKAAYTDAAGTVVQTYVADGSGGQYIALNARGELPAPLFLSPGAYDIVLKRADGSSVWSRYAVGTADVAAALAATLSSTAGAAAITTSTGETVEAQFARFADGVVDAADPRYAGGAKGDGVTDDTAALAAAAATQRPVLLHPGKTYVSGPIVPVTNGKLCFYSQGVGATIKLKAGSNDHLIKNATKATVWLSNVSLDGNRAQNNAQPVNPGVLFNQIGTLVMFGGTVSNGVHDHILSGNLDYSFDQTQKAELVYLSGVTVQAGAATDLSLDGKAPQDAIRIFRTKIVRLINVHTVGGLSGARMGWYNEDVQVLGGTFEQSFADCGITVYMTDRFTINGATCKLNFNNGIECDAANNGAISGCTLTNNGKNGVLFTEYGPPTAGANYVGTYDGVTTSYPNLYPCQGVTLSGNTIRNNGMAGIKCYGQGAGLTIKANHIESNGTTGTTTENCGLFIGGGNLNEDGVIFGANTFVNSGNQTYSVRKSNNQFRTFSEGNTHIGSRHFEYAIDGYRTQLSRGLIQETSRWSGVTGVLVADALALPEPFARAIVDSSTTGTSAAICTFPVGPCGEKIVPITLRTPDTMTTCTVSVALYDGTTSKFSVYNAAVTLTAAYKTIQVEIPDSLSSYAYDSIKVTVTSDPTLTGTIYISGMRPYWNWEF